MQRQTTFDLNEIHANEVEILPYYIANLNIEYTYKELTGDYLGFPNLCFVDTLDNMNWKGASGATVQRQTTFEAPKSSPATAYGRSGPQRQPANGKDTQTAHDPKLKPR